MALSKYKYPLIKRLHELGVVQMTDVGRTMESPEWEQILENHPSDPTIRQITAQVMSFNKILDFFESISPLPEDNFFKMLFSPSPPKKMAAENVYGTKLLEGAERLLEEVNAAIREPEERLNRVTSELNEISTKVESLEKIRDFRVDLADVVKTDHLTVQIGIAPKEQASEISSKLKEVTNGVCYIGSQDISQIEYVVLVVALSEASKEVSDSLRRLGFEKMDVSGLSGTPAEALSKLGERRASLGYEEESLRSEITKLAERWREKLLVHRELLQIERDRLDVQTNFMRTDETFILEGWIPAKSINSVKEEVLKVTKGFSVVKETNPDPSEGDIPVYLQNPPFIRHFQVLTELYGRPKYNEIDPTILLAPVFMLFFGIMLTDAVYGVMMALLGLLILRGGGKYSSSVKDFGVIFAAIGLATIGFGILTGGYLGDFALKYLGISALRPIIFDPMVDVQLFLILVLVIGLIHLNLGLIIGFKENVRQKQYKDAFGDQFWLFLLQIGLALLMIDMKSIGVGLILIGVVLVAIVHGPLFFFDITGYLGDVLSYARLLALGLATTGIAMTVNILSTMVEGVPIIGIVLAAIVFVIGHIFNWGMNGLGGFVHGIRLHYVEFFNKFYEGGGSEYRPYRMRRELTKE
ncbi:V-type ATP synthase subunit I [Methanotrichaceae archaeon M04Ac]|uniref:A-type ATP synthase subunit I n=1 Tax=Candidatus Methanocrinis alkalitolerans TaxID=3033395 RepID=A0ABT5XDU3_9EURY|nr:V-type ATP synthase subunit I [Candidatus Methanocrinis alkalitolerans]MDF0592825.1 V-type ATP synthase subunit I [Candidatus Methanocrinis alkalitolerans]